MNVALFLNPIDIHVRNAFGKRKGAYYAQLATTLGARFRVNGFRVAWLINGTDTDRNVPDFSSLSPDLPIIGSDADDATNRDDIDDFVLVSPLSFNETLSHHMSDQVVEGLLEQLGPVEHLAVCGFNDRSEVEQFARVAAASSQINAVDVHEDLTELGLTDSMVAQLTARPTERIAPFLLELEANHPDDAAIKRIYNTEYRFRSRRPYRQQILPLEQYLERNRSHMAQVA